MALPDFHDVSFTKLAAGVLGAFVSLRWIQGTWLEKTCMGIGGAALSYFASEWLAAKLGMLQAEGLIGFMVGLFGMAIVAKTYEVIQLLDAKQIGADAWGWFARKWKA